MGKGHMAIIFCLHAILYKYIAVPNMTSIGQSFLELYKITMEARDRQTDNILSSQLHRNRKFQRTREIIKMLNKVVVKGRNLDISKQWRI